MRILAAIVLILVAAIPGRAEPAEPQAPGTLRVMAYNIKHGRGMDGKVDVKRIAEVIAAQRPDLVALQEVDRHCGRSGDRDLPAELGQLLGMEHRFAKFMDFDRGEYGLAVLSRLPITASVRHPVPAGAEPRAALEVRVQPAGWDTPISFVCLHHDWTKEEFRVRQVETLLAALHDHKHPVVLAGDFNGERGDASMQLLAKRGWTILDKDDPAHRHTFPSDAPRKEIDFFVTRHFPPVAITHRVIDERIASDHRPILAIIVPGKRNAGGEHSPRGRNRREDLRPP